MVSVPVEESYVTLPVSSNFRYEDQPEVPVLVTRQYISDPDHNEVDISNM